MFCRFFHMQPSEFWALTTAEYEACVDFIEQMGE